MSDIDTFVAQWVEDNDPVTIRIGDKEIENEPCELHIRFKSVAAMVVWARNHVGSKGIRESDALDLSLPKFTLTDDEDLPQARLFQEKEV